MNLAPTMRAKYTAKGTRQFRFAKNMVSREQVRPHPSKGSGNKAAPIGCERSSRYGQPGNHNSLSGTAHQERRKARSHR